MKKAVITVALSVLLALLSANVNTVAHAQGDLVAPSNVAAHNTGNPGEVRISWDAVPNAEYYRIGWVAYSDVEPIIASGGDWLEHFAFIDIENRGQTEQTITRLTPGVQYAFIMASNDGRYGTPRWPPATGWAFLMLNDAPMAQASLGSTEVNLSWGAVPGAEYYRIGWVVYEDVAPIIASGGDWLEHFAFIDISNRGQTQHTIGRLTPGLQYAFIVAGNDGRYGTPQWPPASAWQFLTPDAGQPSMQQPDSGQPQTDQPPCPAPGWTVTPRPVSTVRGDYDADDDGLIEVANLAQLDAMRYDPWGRGSPSDEDLASYFGAFPNAVAGMGCPEAGCTGYELVVDLDFDTNGNGRADAGDTYWNNGAGWLPITFNRDFDGGGHTIANLHIYREFDRDDQGSIGLFGDMDGDISRVALTSIVVGATDDTPVGGVNVGGLAGSFNGSLSDSCVAGIVSGNRNVGGLVGSADRNSSISGSYATGNVSGDTNVGGLIGFADRKSSISGSYATGTVTGSVQVGGLVGSGGSISESYATGNVSGDSNVGGLSGYAYVVSGSYATGTVTGSVQVGGLIGSGGGGPSGSYATGNVSGTRDVGGLVGSGRGARESYATGNVSGDSQVGGLVGSGGRNSSISGSYATGNVSGDTNVGGLVGSARSGSSIRESYATGTVTGSGGVVGGLVGDARFGSSIRESHATGTVSGGGGYVGGLAGYADSINRSYATGAVTGGGGYVGGLAGYAGSIGGSYATGTVTGGGDRVGGLAGDAGSIGGSYATGTVAGSGDRVGGLAGDAGSISASYATGTVTGNFRVGGLVGQTGGNTSYSYAIGKVSGTGVVGGLIGDNTGTVTDSYWDTVTSGQSHSDGGRGKMTSELQLPTGYTGIYANWNVDLDDRDRDRNPMTGGDDPWDFGMSSQYPALKYGGLDPTQQRR